jgi:hypothetical protein
MRVDFYKCFWFFGDALDGVTIGVRTRFVVPQGEHAAGSRVERDARRLIYVDDVFPRG